MRISPGPLALIALLATGAIAQPSADAAYDDRLRSAMASAAAFQGPMDGAWTLTAGTRELFLLQMADRNGVVEGAWRDPRRPGALEGSGFIEQVERTASSLTFRIGDQVIALNVDAEGRWAGELTRAGGTEAVTLRRRVP